TLKDWDWGMGVNFWGPLCGVRAFVPRMRARGEGCHIVTTSSTDGVLFGSGNVYAVTKMAVTGFMEALRHELRTTNIGTSNLLPGAATTNLAQRPSYRPEGLMNETAPETAVTSAPATSSARPAAPAPPRTGATQPDAGPLWARPQDPLTVGRLVVDGVLHNDMWIFPAPEYRVGVEARGQAMPNRWWPTRPCPNTSRQGATTISARRSTCRRLPTVARR